MTNEANKTLSEAKYTYIPKDMQERGDTPINARLELYKRAYGIAETLVNISEKQRNINLQNEVEKLAEANNLSKEQKNIFELVAKVIEEDREKTTKVISAAEQNREEFMRKYKTEITQLGLSELSSTNKIFGVMLFHAKTGKFPTEYVKLSNNQNFIRLKVFNDEDMKTIHEYDTPGGFFIEKTDFNFENQTLQAPLVVVGRGNSNDAYWTELHEKNHHTFSVLERAKREHDGRHYKSIHKLTDEWNAWIFADSGLMPTVAEYNQKKEVGSFEEIREYFFERARDEILTVHRTGRTLDDFGSSDKRLEQYLVDWGFNVFIKKSENIMSIKDYVEPLKNSLKEDIRSYTKYGDRILLGMQIAQNNDAVHAFESILESKKFVDWHDEIEKTFKGDQKFYFRMGNILRELQKKRDKESRQEDIYWTQFRNIQNALVFGTKEMGIPISEITQQLESKVTELESDLKI